MAKKSLAELSENDFKRLFPNAVAIVKRNRNKRHAGFFEPTMLNKALNDALNGKAIDLDVFYAVAKIGRKNDDAVHKEYYVKRALKIEALKQLNNTDLLKATSFNHPKITAELNRKINSDAIQSLSVEYQDGSVKTQLLIDAKNLIK